MKKRKYTPFTAADVATIKRMNEQGKSNAEIAHKLKRTAPQIAQKKFHLGLKQKPSDGSLKTRKKHKRRWTMDEVELLRKMRYQERQTIENIAVAVGRTQISVRAKLRAVEAEMRAYEETSLLWGMVKFKTPVR